MSKFNGGSGRLPLTEARRYVYRILIPMLDNELNPDQAHGWMFGGIDEESDHQRLVKAIKSVMKEMKRKAEKLK